MGLGSYYYGKVTNDKNREIRITCLGMDLDDSKKIKLFSTIIPIRDTLPSMPRDAIMNKKRENTYTYTSKGEFAGATYNNSTVSEKQITITVGDDLVLNIGKNTSLYSSFLKNMITGELFKTSNSSVLGVCPLGILGNVVDVSGGFPNMVFGQDWKYIFTKDTEMTIPYGRGLTKPNSLIANTALYGLALIVEYKTMYGDGTASVVRYSGGIGSNVQDLSADDLNKFSVDITLFAEGREYTDYISYRGYNFDSDTSSTINNIAVEAIVTGTLTPSDYGTSGKLYAFVNNGTVEVHKSNGVSWNTTGGSKTLISGTLLSGTKIFSNKISATTISSATTTTGKQIIALKSGGVGTGVAVATTVTAEGNTSYTLGTTYVIQCMDYDFYTNTFIPLIS